jgi:putative membrane protein
MRLAAFVLAALPGAALAQIGNPGFMSPGTRFESPGVPAPNQTNATDQLFARLAAEGGLAEVSLAELVVGKARDPAVDAFARRMIDDHEPAGERLAALAEAAAIPLPDAPSPEHAALHARLEALDAAALDLAYMRAQVVDHQKTVQLLVWEIGQGQDAAIQRFAAETLPTVLDHLASARSILAEIERARIAASAPTPAPRPPN